MFIYEEQTTDADLIARVRARYGSGMNELRSLEFRELCYYVEFLAPFSLLFLFPIYFAMRSKAEVLVHKPPLRIAGAYAVLAHQGQATFATPMGMGVKFYTGFTDGLTLVTSDFDSQVVDHPRLQKSGRAQPLQWAWVYHQKQIESLRGAGREPLSSLTFEGYCTLSRVEMEIFSRPTGN